MSEADGNPVVHWFGPRFSLLHPLLQDLHRQGGELSGEIELRSGQGLAGIAGRLLARKLGLPAAGHHAFKVTIQHDGHGLHWRRRIGAASTMSSFFVPHGQWPKGHWVESTGPVRLTMTVDIIDGGWHWRCLAIHVGHLRLPLWLFPRTLGYKRIENDRYAFRVAIAVPLLGEILSYGGSLSLQAATSPASAWP